MRHQLLVALCAVLALPLIRGAGIELDAVDEPAGSARAPLALHAHGEEGWGFVGDLGEGEGTALVPLLARSERVARGRRERAGYRLRIASPRGEDTLVESVRVLAVDHPPDHQVLLIHGQPRLVGPPVLPAAAQAVGVAEGSDPDRLPELARQDMNSVGDLRLLARAPRGAGLPWVLIGAERGAGEPVGRVSLAGGPARELPAGPRRALVVPPAAELELELEGAPLDQLFLATVDGIRAEELRPLSFAALRLVELRAIEPRPWRGEGPPRPEARFGRDRPAPDADRLAAQLPGGLEDPLRLRASEALELVVSPGERSPRGLTRTLVVEVLGRGAAAPAPGADARPEAVSAATRGSGAAAEPAAAPLFVDVAREAGVAMVHFEGPDEQLDIRPTMGPGAAFGDVDGDGWVDLYLVQGAGREGSEPPRNRLLRNRGDGTFADVSRASGADHAGAGMAALFLDVNGNGHLDLYVANYGPDVLLENRGDGTFVDVSEPWGVGGDLWSAGIAAADFDGDGDLDLYITSYLDYDPALMPAVEELSGMRREDPVEMLPFAFPGARNVFLRNRVADAVDPAHAFEDATEALGLLDEQGRGMQPVFWDFDLDGRPDLYIANDVSPNVLLRNEGDGTFRDISFQSGMDDPRGGMGVTLGDVDGDGDEDLFLTNWQLEANALYLNNLVVHDEGRHRVATFRDAIVRSGLGPAGVGVTSWGCVLFDMDCSGALDLYIANGYTSPDYASTGICVGQPDHLFRNDGRGVFEDLSTRAGPDLMLPLASRGAIACDFDQDGDLDLLVTANNGRTRLLRNDVPRAGRWLGLRLRGQGANTHAIGARVIVRTSEAEHMRVLAAGTSYLMGNAPELHFGLGPIEEGRVEVEVHWPFGPTSTHQVEPDQLVLLRQPAP